MAGICFPRALRKLSYKQGMINMSVGRLQEKSMPASGRYRGNTDVCKRPSEAPPTRSSSFVRLAQRRHGRLSEVVDIVKEGVK
jgi:hypothetical protein